MFNETESLAHGEFDRLIEQTGGDTNAATWVDWTYYRTTVPARDLELAVRLEADRMQNLLWMGTLLALSILAAPRAASAGNRQPRGSPTANPVRLLTKRRCREGFQTRKSPQTLWLAGPVHGRGERIRTFDLSVPNAHP